jgi:enterobactin synthetase component F
MRDVHSCPLSTAQQEVCLALSQSQSNLNYHLCDVIELRGELNQAWLEAAIRAQFLQTDTLRATFEIDPATGTYAQYIQPADALPAKAFESLDVSHRSDPVQACNELLEHLLHQDMDLQHGPLIRYVLVRLAPQHYRMIELASHLVVDGFGHGILFGNITAHNNALSRGEAVATLQLAPLASVYAAQEDYRHSDMYTRIAPIGASTA